MVAAVEDSGELAQVVARGHAGEVGAQAEVDVGGLQEVVAAVVVVHHGGVEGLEVSLALDQIRAGGGAFAVE